MLMNVPPQMDCVLMLSVPTQQEAMLVCVTLASVKPLLHLLAVIIIKTSHTVLWNQFLWPLNSLSPGPLLISIVSYYSLY